MVRELTPADERRHRPSGQPWWGESWQFDAVDDTGLGLFVQFTLVPAQRRCWFVAAVVRPGKDIVVCHDIDADAPPSAVLEIRSNGLWSHAICETPFQHWTVAMEAYALELSDPRVGWTPRPVGDRIGLAFDLEWESVIESISNLPRTGEEDKSGPSGYEFAATIHGEVQVDDDNWTFDGTGRWRHRWGEVGDGSSQRTMCTTHETPMVEVCWLAPAPGEPAKAIRHLSPAGWCDGAA